MEKVIIGLLCSLLLVGSGNVETSSYQYDVEEEITISLDENSLSLSLNSFFASIEEHQ